MSRKVKPIPKAELDGYYADAENYLLKPWLTRPLPYREPLIVGGKGAYFYDATGREYLDFLSQLFNINLGNDGAMKFSATEQKGRSQLGLPGEEVPTQ